MTATAVKSYVPPIAVAHCQECETEWNSNAWPACFNCGGPGEPGGVRGADGKAILWNSKQVIPVQWAAEDLDEGLEGV